MNLRELTGKFHSFQQFSDVITGKQKSVSGLAGSSAAAFYAALALGQEKPVILISQRPYELARDITHFVGADKVACFPAWDTFPTEDISPSKEIVGERLKVLDGILDGEKKLITANAKAMATRVMPKDVLKNHRIIMQLGSRIKRDELAKQLVAIGYKRRDIVGERGEFSVRGAIIDVFAANNEYPARIELFGDVIESIRCFEPANQRSTNGINKVKILPLHELVLEGGGEYVDGIEVEIPRLYPDFSSILEYFTEPLLVIDGPQHIKLAWEKFVNESEDINKGSGGKYYLDHPAFMGIASGIRVIENTEEADGMSLGFAPAEDFYGNLDRLSEWLAAKKNDNAVFIVGKQIDRLYELFMENGLPAQKIEEIPQGYGNGLYILYGELEGGFSGNGIIMLTDREVFGLLPTKVRFTPKPSEGVSGQLLAELRPGDYVVHSNYGIGIFRGLEKLDIGGATQEYIEIDYADEDKLYVPLHQMGLVEKYAAGGDFSPKIGRLGGVEWARTKARAKKSIKDMTRELLDLYASRQKENGFKYPPDSLWELDFEKSFPYEETGDQSKAIIDIKKDMEAGRLLDRLVCGDVGYGKTEVALRAAFKTALSGRQVAVLTPTTVLADQHFRTFSQRMKPYPITVEMLSRFRGKDEQKNIIRSIEAGQVDIVIGTHRLIQKDVRFRDIGLVIVDEEQKFGVAHKERLKQIARNVNVITLTATPIPRTLYMALSGAREMSIISTPPLDRSPVRTYLRQWDENVIKEAIRRELERGGQVFFVHNYVKSIDKIARLVSQVVPEARIAVAHGQMKETQLEDIMIKFINREYDVLVSTSIIESGLDIPSVNTVIIDRAEDFGLSQLYQIRGRVGRSSTRAFAYLLYHREKALTDKALERLKAIQDFTALGSGYKLAMADLEIRGMGNILGAEQHGHMLNIGFDMYCDLLEESVREIKHIDTPLAKRVLIDLKVDAFIPQEYVPDDKQRIAIYKRLNLISSNTELHDFKSEMVDRFGRIPQELEALFKIIELKVEASSRGVTSITGGREGIEIRFEQKKPLTLRTKGSPQDAWLRGLHEMVARLPR